MLSTRSCMKAGEMMSKAKEYAFYKGDELLAMGTVAEIGYALGILPKTVHFYKTPSYRKRVSEKNRYEVVQLDK